MRYLIATIVASAMLAGTTFAATINVPGDYETIHQAVSAAQPGDVVLLAPGTYELNSGILVSKSLTIRGAGGSDETFITSSLQNSLLLDFRFLSSNASSESVVEGITFDSIPNSTYTITFEGNSEWPLNGKVRDCRFLNSGGSSSSNGGSILFNGHGLWEAGEVSDCVFQNNTASGPPRCISASEIDDLTISSCTFDSNTDFKAVRLTKSNATVNDCVFSNNSLDDNWGAAISWTEHGNLDVSNCLFENNSAPKGGAIQMSHSSPLPLHIVITNCEFKQNVASTGSAIYNYYSQVESLSISNTTFCENTDPAIDGDWIDDGGNTFYDSCDDEDSDGIPDGKDNCPLSNPDQADCNENGIGDICDIADGSVNDMNANSIPDECECLSDIYEDGTVDVLDLLLVINFWGNSGGDGDVNYDGAVDVIDLLGVIDAWGPCE